ncbi:DMT family transporter [Clostridium guangxiense]|uniref:DMT family transporter n=1 Tax=Clostridium guangxiense TaxID=1662055 RepID=UPI001E49B8BD|nr:DMT family transporter [Clostridium guangxiense]MCD2346616.1 DMT family transporter [Clostridium guangxiense]
MDTKKFLTNKKIIIILATICCLLWGSAFPGVKTGYSLFKISANDIPSKFVFAGYRFTLAGIIVLIIAVISGKNILIFNKKNILQIIILGLTQTTIQYVFFYIGLGYTTGSKGSIVNATLTFFSIILAHFIYRNDRLNFNKVIGCTLGFIGVIAANLSSDVLKLSFSFKGEGLVMFSAFAASASSIYGKKITQSLDSIIVTGYQLFIGGFILTALGLLNRGSLSTFTPESTLLLFYLAILSSTAFSIWTALLKYNKVGFVSMFNFLVPVFGVLLSAIILKENILDIKNLVALILVCIGIILANSEKAYSN